MKILVITHSRNMIYGAAKSLGILLNNFDIRFDFIFPKSILQCNDINKVKAYAGNNCDNIYEFFVPFSRAVQDDVGNWKLKVEDALTAPLISRDRLRIRSLILKSQYDLILLNSNVLFTLIEPAHKYVLYSRELFTGNEKWRRRFIDHINNAAGVIAISEEITDVFSDTHISSKVIYNPFDMTEINNVCQAEAKYLFPEISSTKIVLTIAGQVSSSKGIDFVIRAFKKCQRDDLQLLVVGEGMSKNYYSYCKELSEGLDVVFIPPQQSMIPIYKLSDYVVRGDISFAIGRTVYEALYSGMNVIINTDEPSQVKYIKNYDDFKERIYRYKTADVNSLCTVFSSIPSAKAINKTGISTVPEYIKEIRSYFDSI